MSKQYPEKTANNFTGKSMSAKKPSIPSQDVRSRKPVTKND